MPNVYVFELKEAVWANRTCLTHLNSLQPTSDVSISSIEVIGTSIDRFGFHAVPRTEQL